MADDDLIREIRDLIAEIKSENELNRRQTSELAERYEGQTSELAERYEVFSRKQTSELAERYEVLNRETTRRYEEQLGFTRELMRRNEIAFNDSRRVLAELVEESRAQRGALLVLIDEFRGHGPRPATG